MMKIFMMLLFMIPLCFLSNMFWMVYLLFMIMTWQENYYKMKMFLFQSMV